MPFKRNNLCVYACNIFHLPEKEHINMFNWWFIHLADDLSVSAAIVLPLKHTFVPPPGPNERISVRRQSKNVLPLTHVTSSTTSFIVLGAALQSSSSPVAIWTHYIMACAVYIRKLNNGHRLFASFFFFKFPLISWLDDQDFNSSFSLSFIQSVSDFPTVCNNRTFHIAKEKRSDTDLWANIFLKSVLDIHMPCWTCSG